MRIIPQGRPFISHLLSLASCAHTLEDHISITDSRHNELSLWISFLKQWNGLSFFYSNLISSPVDIQLYTDAAPSVGFGVFFQGRWFASIWPPQLAHLPQHLSSSALFELYPLVAAASLWGKKWSATSIVVHCDNEATVHCINKEIQIAGTRGGPAPNPSSSLFRTDIPINHPLRPFLEASINSILQAVSPRTLQSYLSAWKCFKTFLSAYSLPFPDFSLLSITSFISHLNINKNLQISSIKGYLSGIQFFHKLLYGLPSPHITNSQTSLLIKGIQKTHPNRPDPRQPITLKILTKCISTLRKGYHSVHTARTLDAMFILAFFGFLRCSELAITSGFNPAIHPTISDLAVLDDETISYFIKQSKTGQTKKGHFIYIFNLQSPIQPFQAFLAFLQVRKSQSKLPSDPLFTDDFNRPATRFWFQKRLKSILLLSGTPADNFFHHSFRIGAATTAAQKGLSQQQIQALGRCSARSRWSFVLSPPLPQQCPLPLEHLPYCPTAAAVPAPAGALFSVPHCRSSARSRRSFILSPPLPQQCPLPQELCSQSPTAAAVPAPAGALFSVPHCRSSARSRRSFIPQFPLPQQRPLPQEPFFRILPQQCLQELLAYFPFFATTTNSGGSAYWVRAECRARTPLPRQGECPGFGNDYRARSPLPDSTPNTHNLYSVYYFFSQPPLSSRLLLAITSPLSFASVSVLYRARESTSLRIAFWVVAAMF
ncbi:hypothetical protein M9458_056508 [Cirrhinus mrigala]|uniref:Uncharacterized protein n=1 Tax=Cirrhinus mrigala TaxID=683832 RepID=A0ABD0MDQ9_CIRMR